MIFDLGTLFGLLVVQTLLLAALLPLLMGWQPPGSGARYAQLGMALQGGGWLALWLLLRGQPPGWLLGTLGLALLSASLSCLWLALRAWLGPQPGRQAMLAMPLLLALAYLASQSQPGLSIALSAGLFGLQLLALCLNLARPARRLAPELLAHSRRWRGVLLICLLLLTALSFWRGAQAFWGDSTGLAVQPSLQHPHALDMLAALLAHLTLTLGLAAILVAWRGESENQLLRHAQADLLTGLGNRRALLARAPDMIALARRYQEPLVLLLLAVEGLPGKASPDEPTLAAEGGESQLQLQRFGRCLRDCVRPGDLAVRLGDERFALLMVRTDTDGPAALDARLRRAMAEAASEESPPLVETAPRLNFSAGWARLRSGDRSLDDLMRRAEAALGEARRSGRGESRGEGGGNGRLQAEPGAEQA